MAAPRVPIDVDPHTGEWSTDGLAMIYLPRHFFVGYHKAMEAELGTARYAELLHEAGYLSAFTWCAETARTGGRDGLDVFRHYLARLSQRGWGRFRVIEVDAPAGRARIRVDHSVFVAEATGGSSGGLCTMFAGWFAGAMGWVDSRNGVHRTFAGTETRCAGLSDTDHCLFEVMTRERDRHADDGGF